jgi:hypothetical protein
MSQIEITGVPYGSHPVGEHLDMDDKYASVLVKLHRARYVTAAIEDEHISPKPAKAKRKYKRRDMRAEK